MNYIFLFILIISSLQNRKSNKNTMKNLHIQTTQKQSLRKHRRIKSQQFIHSPNNHLIPSNKTSHHHKLQVTSSIKSNQQNLIVEVIRKDSNKLKLKFTSQTPLKIVKENICKKLELEKNSIYFYTINQDYNFDYRFQEQIGTLNTNLKLCYGFINNQYRQNKNQNEAINQSSQLTSYFIYDCLSVGGFSKVFLTRSKKSGKFYAAKFIHKNLDPSPKFRQLIYNQKFINQMLDYPMLVKMHQFLQTNQFYIFILDYCPSGQLFCLMKNHRDMSQDQAKFYFLQTILGIQHMHSQSIIYRDIKPQNILLDKNGHIKIADFGLSKIMRQKSVSYCGSLQYMAPQIVLGNQHSFGVDHYCLGSLLFQLMVGCPPFYNPNFTPPQTKYHIVNSQVKFPSKRHYSPELIDFINKLLDKNPKTRLGSLGGIKQILSHPWIGKFDREKYQKHQITPPFIVSLNQSNFQTAYLPKQSIQQTKHKILVQLQQKQIKSKGFKKQNKVCDQFSDKIIKKRLKLNYQQSQVLPKRPKSKSKLSTGNFLYYKEQQVLNPYELFISKNRSSKKISYSLSKSQSKSLHLSTQQSKNRSQSKINKLYANNKCFTGQNTPKSNNNQYKIHQSKKQFQKFRKSTENVQQLKRKNNRKSTNGNGNKQNVGELSNFRLKHQNLKEKNIRKILGDYVRYTSTDGIDNLDRKINKTWKCNKAIFDAFSKQN